MKKHNFSAGPSILPQSVLKKTSQAVIDLDGSGLSVLEISHRSKAFREIIQEAKHLVKELLNVPQSHEILFLHGGASMEFLMVPYNLLSEGGRAGYIITGIWSSKAFNEAKGIGRAVVIASSESKNFSYIPKEIYIPKGLDYVHFTSNNTIYGTQFKTAPISNTPLVADMSSDIFSKCINVDEFDLIYAGAQKNIGPAGTTLVIIRESILDKKNVYIPTIINYAKHIESGSLLNTPCVFSIYTSLLNLKWLKQKGGVREMEKKNEEKAELLYKSIDESPYLKGIANKEDRSNMNVTFSITDSGKEKIFQQRCIENGIEGIKGHRLVGGYRASIYNALPLESVNVLVSIIRNL